MIVKQSSMVNQIEIVDYFVRKLKGMAITPNELVLVMSKHLKRYVPDRRQLGIACNKVLGGIDQFTEFKVIHGGTVQYKRPNVQDDHKGSVAVNKFQGQVRKNYLINLNRN